MIDIIIVTYNAEKNLRRCLKSVKKYTNGIKYKLTTVDNNCSDGTKDFLFKYKERNEINVITLNKNLGFSGGANIAFKKTDNKYIVMLDDDAEVTEGWLDRLYNCINKNSKIGIVGCKIVFPDGVIHSADYRVIHLQLMGFDEIDRGQRDYVKECDALIGTCWIMRREVVKKVGYFDERFFPSQHEDIDYCLRTRLAGYKIVYNGRVKIIHHNLFRDDNNNNKNLNLFTRKWSKSLEKFPLKDSHPIDKFIARGLRYLNVGKYKLALKMFLKVEDYGSIFSEPLYKGIALEALGKDLDAIKVYQNIFNSRGRGDCYDSKNRLKNIMKKSIGINNGGVLLRKAFLKHMFCARIYSKQGESKKAKLEAAKSLHFFNIYRDRYLDV